MEIALFISAVMATQDLKRNEQKLSFLQTAGQPKTKWTGGMLHLEACYC